MKFSSVFVVSNPEATEVEDFAKWLNEEDGIVPVMDAWKFIGIDEDDNAYILDENGNVVGNVEHLTLDEIMFEESSFSKAVNALTEYLNLNYGYWVEKQDSYDEPPYPVCLGLVR